MPKPSDPADKRPPGRPRKPLTEDDHAQILRLRRAGATHAAISRQLKISTTAVLQSLAESVKRSVQETPEIRAQLDFERLDAILLSLWEQVKNGNTAAIDKAMKVIDARAKMVDTYRLAVAPPSGLELSVEEGTLALLGKPETVERKMRLLLALEQHFTVSEACRVAAVPLSLYYEWLENDPLFQDYTQTARASVVDRVETRLIEVGHRGNVTALLAFLNAHHPSYGRIRYEIIERMLAPWIDEVLRIVTAHVPTSTTEQIRRELWQSAELYARRSSG